MSNDPASGSSQDAGSRQVPAAGIGTARAQVEAARTRLHRLVASGHLAGSANNDSPVNMALPGYTLLRELHRGGQGVVCLAVQNSTGRQVAIKLLKRDLPLSSDAAGMARFEREIEILSRLKHPNIVTVHDCGRDHGQLYLVMDYVDGQPLDTWVDRERTPLAETLDMFARVCDGVNAAHLRGVIHRDLKPGNILVDARGEPHVLDFGLAKIAERSEHHSTQPAMTITGQFVGSLPWASPEQAEGRMDTLDLRTDVYSLGVLLYQILTGQFPYPVAGRQSEVVRHIVGTDPARPSSIESRIDRELETIILKCLAKEPVRRYQNAGELARDIRRYLAGEVIEARRDSLGYVMGKRLERYRTAAIATGATLAVALAALIISIAFWRQAARQAVIAQANATDARESAQRADREAAEARAISDFLHDVVTSVDPQNQGADVRLLQVIQDASVTASQRFAGHPRQEAEVRDMLGQVYDRLSMWTEARNEFKRAADNWQQVAGPDDPRTLAVRARYVGELLNLEQNNDAQAALADLVPRFERVLGPDDPQTLDTHRQLAISALLRGRVDEAESMLNDLRGRPNIAHDDSAQIRILTGLLAVQSNRYSYVEPEGMRALLLESEAIANEWIERSTRLLGPNSTMALQARLKRAETICALGRYEAAAATCREILEHFAGRLGACHIIRSNALLVLAEALTGLGDEREPADLHLQRLECLRQQLPTDSPAFLATLSDSLRFVERAGRAAEGETLARELCAALARHGGGHDDMEYTSQFYVAHFVSIQNRLDEADALFSDLLAHEDRLVDGQRTSGRLHLFYAMHLTRRGRFAEAESHLNTAAEMAGGIRVGTWDSHPDDIVLAYIALYEAWNKPDKRDEYQRTRDEMRALAMRDAKRP